MHYDEFRREYTAGGLTRDMLDADPLRQFEHWLEQAVKAGLEDPTGMVLATVDKNGAPWQRIVLLKGLSRGGFAFYTHFGSAKAVSRADLADLKAVDGISDALAETIYDFFHEKG